VGPQGAGYDLAVAEDGVVLRLFVVTRRDLPAGDQVAQTLHAGLELAAECSTAFVRWHTDTNTVVCKTVATEHELEALFNKLVDGPPLPLVSFREPDRNNEMTSIAFLSSGGGAISHLPLVLADDSPMQP
jgi:hypothetical protein